MKRRRFAVAVVAAVIAVAAAALLAHFVGEDEANPARDQILPLAVGRPVITRGEDWAFVAWKGARGLCTSIVFPTHEARTSCGMPIAGALPDSRSPQHLVVGGASQPRPDDDLWIDGVVVADASRVEVELADGRRVEAPIFNAPAGLGLDLKFFLVRARPPEDPPEVGVPPFRAFSAYDAQGRLLERFGPPTPEKVAIEDAVFRYETWARRRTLRAVDCDRPAPLFRGKPAFRCSIRFKDSNGLDAHCYALVGRALYEVGGCFPPPRDLGAGKSRLLLRSIG
jgi:hypothetical protein